MQLNFQYRFPREIEYPRRTFILPSSRIFSREITCFASHEGGGGKSRYLRANSCPDRDNERGKRSRRGYRYRRHGKIESTLYSLYAKPQHHTTRGNSRPNCTDVDPHSEETSLSCCRLRPLCTFDGTGEVSVPRKINIVWQISRLKVGRNRFQLPSVRFPRFPFTPIHIHPSLCLPAIHCTSMYQEFRFFPPIIVYPTQTLRFIDSIKNSTQVLS